MSGGGWPTREAYADGMSTHVGAGHARPCTSPQTPGTGKPAFLAPSARGLPPQRVGGELRGYPKYFGLWQGSLPPALRGHLPRRGRQGGGPSRDVPAAADVHGSSGTPTPTVGADSISARAVSVAANLRGRDESLPYKPPRKRTAPGNPRAGHIRPLLRISHF